PPAHPRRLRRLPAGRLPHRGGDLRPPLLLPEERLAELHPLARAGLPGRHDPAPAQGRARGDPPADAGDAAPVPDRAARGPRGGRRAPARRSGPPAPRGRRRTSGRTPRAAPAGRRRPRPRPPGAAAPCRPPARTRPRAAGHLCTAARGWLLLTAPARPPAVTC